MTKVEVFDGVRQLVFGGRVSGHSVHLDRPAARARYAGWLTARPARRSARTLQAPAGQRCVLVLPMAVRGVAILARMTWPLDVVQGGVQGSVVSPWPSVTRRMGGWRMLAGPRW